MTCCLLRQKPYFAACCACNWAILASSALAILTLEALLSVFFFSAFSASSAENAKKKFKTLATVGSGKTPLLELDYTGDKQRILRKKKILAKKRCIESKEKYF